MPPSGLEPPRAFAHSALNAARLPIPPRPRGDGKGSGSRRACSVCPAPPRLAVVSVGTGRYCAEHMFAPSATPEGSHPTAMDIGKELTKRQQEIYDFIRRYSAKYGYPPTMRDIGKAVGLASSSTVHAH